MEEIIPQRPGHVRKLPVVITPVQPAVRSGAERSVVVENVCVAY